MYRTEHAVITRYGPCQTHSTSAHRLTPRKRSICTSRYTAAVKPAAEATEADVDEHSLTFSVISWLACWHLLVVGQRADLLAPSGPAPQGKLASSGCCSNMAHAIVAKPCGPGLQDYLHSKIEELELAVRDKSLNLKRLEAQRNVLNSQGASLAKLCAWHRECSTRPIHQSCICSQKSSRGIAIASRARITCWRSCEGDGIIVYRCPKSVVPFGC